MTACYIQTRPSQMVPGMQSMLRLELVAKPQHLLQQRMADGAAMSHCQVLGLWPPKLSRRLLRLTISRKSAASDLYIHITMQLSRLEWDCHHSHHPRPIPAPPQQLRSILRLTTTTITITYTVPGIHTAPHTACSHLLQATPTANHNLCSTPYTHTQRQAHKYSPWAHPNT